MTKPNTNECHYPIVDMYTPQWWCGEQVVDGEYYCSRHAAHVTTLPRLLVKAGTALGGWKGR
jgi:hypothetical protein